MKKIQQKLADSKRNASYKIETSVVYNSALDSITINDEIKLILVADNPGRREQEIKNRRYLTGPSGKIAGNYFKNNPSLGIDFSKNVIILNKTPIHTPRTADLRDLCKLDKKSKIKIALEESQNEMAAILFEFQEALDCPVWITGYSEMKKNGIFENYTDKLKYLYKTNDEKTAQLFFYRHFSMNQFTIDFKQQSLPHETVTESLNRIGRAHRIKILGYS